MAIDFDDSILQWGAYPAEDFLHRDTDCALAFWVKVPAGATTLQWIAGMDAGASASNYRAFGAYYRGDQDTKNIAYFKASVDTYYDIGVPTPDGWTCVVISRPTSGGANTSTSTKMAVGATDSTQNTFANTAADLGRFIVGAIRDVFATPQYKNRSNAKLWGWAIYQRVLTDAEINTLQGGGTVDDITAAGGGAPVVYHYFETPNAGLTTSVSQVGARTMTFTGAPVVDTDTPFPTQTITSVNGGTGVKVGSTGNTAVTDGFTSAPNAGTFGGKAITVTGYDAGAKVATFNGPVVVGGESFPAFTGAQTLVLTNGAESASLAGVPIAPADGSTLVTVATPNNIDERAFGHILVAEGVTPEDGDTFYGVDADVDWLPTTFGSAVDLPVVTPVKFRKTSTGIAYELLLEVNGEGVVPPDATPDTGHRTRSLLRVSGSTLTIDGVTHTNGQPISLSPYGGVQSSINGAWLAQSVSASSGSLVVDGATIVPPKALYLSPAGKLTTTPNGQPVAVARS